MRKHLGISTAVPLAVVCSFWSNNGFSQPVAPETRPQTPPPIAAPPPIANLPPIAVVVKLGLLITGTGTDHSSCDGSDCNAVKESNLTYNHQVSPHFAAEVLWQTLDWMRTGPGMSYTLPGKLKFDNVSGKMDYGSVFSANWVLELTPRVGPKFWLLPRIQAGYSMLIPSGDFEDRLNTWQDVCKDSTAQFKGCNALSGVHSGANLGLGFGALHAVGSQVRLRLDALVDLYWFRIASLSATAASAEFTESSYGARVLLQGGMEF